jgi:predicted HicB family RNase H-like nuclease
MKKQVNMLIDEDLIKEVQHLAIDKNISVSELVENLLKKEVNKK